MINEMQTTLAILRIVVLLGWIFYSMFERRPTKLMRMLVLLLIIPNAVGVYVGLFGA